MTKKNTESQSVKNDKQTSTPPANLDKQFSSTNRYAPHPSSPGLDDSRIMRYRHIADEMKSGHFYSPIKLRGVGDELDQLGQSLYDLGGSLDRKFQEVKTLLRVTQKINSGLVLEQILISIYESFQAIIPYNRIGFALLDDKGAYLTAHWARTESTNVKLKPGFRASMAGSSLLQIINTGQPRIINDLNQYLLEHPKSESTRLIVEEGVASSLTCPLIALNKPIGFIFFSSFHKNSYEHVHIELFLQIAAELSVIVEKGRLYQLLLEEQARSQSLLLNILPPSIVPRLKGDANEIADTYPEVTVLFADIVGFTTFSATITAEDLVIFLNQVFSGFDALVEKYDLEKIKTIGDAYMAAGGLFSRYHNHSESVAGFALEMLESVRDMKSPSGEPLQLRVGIHTGPVVAGIIGKKKFTYDLWGDTVNVASRMESGGMPGRIQVSQVVADALNDRFELEERGVISIKGKGDMKTWFLNGVK